MVVAAPHPVLAHNRCERRVRIANISEKRMVTILLVRSRTKGGD